jgi:HlyD family secretion protein
MRRRNLIIGTLAILALGGYLGYTQVYAPSAAPTPTPESGGNFEAVIWASGEVVPARRASLGFPIGGLVVELPVSKGDNVTAGTVLARLDATELEDALASAEASLARAHAELTRLKIGPRPAEIAQAEDAVRSTQAAGEAARSRLAQAQANLDLLLAGAKPEEITAAKAVMKKAEVVLRKAQDDYDKISWSNDVKLSPEAQALERASIDYEEAKAKYEALLRGARPQEVEAAQAAVAEAQALLEQAEAEAASAQAALDLLREQPTPEEVAVAEAVVMEAESRLKAAQTALSRSVLVAPFDGTVSDIYIREGEQVVSGQIGQAVMELGDLKTLRVETTDLRETDVGRIAIGQEVDITLDALPGVQLKGHIVNISPKSSKEQGGVNYTTFIEFDKSDPRLRWGMTAYVNITVD